MKTYRRLWSSNVMNRLAGSKPVTLVFNSCLFNPIATVLNNRPVSGNWNDISFKIFLKPHVCQAFYCELPLAKTQYNCGQTSSILPVITEVPEN